MPETSMAPSVSHRAKCNHVNTDVPVHVYIYECVTCMYSLCIYSISVHVCVCVRAPYSPTFGDPSARHLEPPLLPVTHTQDLPPVPPTHPPRALSLTRQINC